MKRYRFRDPKPSGILQKARPLIVMFVGWNLLGVIAWKFLNSNMTNNDPAWESRPEYERIAALTGSKPQDTMKYNYSLLGKQESESDN